jgi:hypothetical protein
MNTNQRKRRIKFVRIKITAAINMYVKSADRRTSRVPWISILEKINHSSPILRPIRPKKENIFLAFLEKHMGYTVNDES